MRIQKHSSAEAGFSLVQMSIVLIIIGFIVGGIITGKSLIQSAEVSAQITQINKYNTAVHLFETKYGYMPGDIPAPYATNYGFQPRGIYDGEGDGNGLLRGNCQNIASTAYNHNFYVGCGETAVFWNDLSVAGLIDTTVYGCDTHGVHYPCIGSAGTAITLSSSPAAIKDWLPAAKIGQNNFIYVYSIDTSNYFTLGSVTQLNFKVHEDANPGIPVQQAYMIDNKIDDGLPQSGVVNACYLNNAVTDFVAIWAAGGLTEGASGGSKENGSNHCIASTAATPSSGNTCFDNSNTNGTQMTYSISSNPNVPNCALSFQFQ